MATSAVYSIDSSALIHGWRRIYRPKNFGFVWERFDALMEEGRLRASIEVYNELEKKDDELFRWCKDRKENMFVEIDEDPQNHVTRIMRNHPRLGVLYLLLTRLVPQRLIELRGPQQHILEPLTHSRRVDGLLAHHGMGCECIHHRRAMLMD